MTTTQTQTQTQTQTINVTYNDEDVAQVVRKLDTYWVVRGSVYRDLQTATRDIKFATRNEAKQFVTNYCSTIEGTGTRS